MMEINLKNAQDIETGESNTFGKNEEKSIISLAFDQSEFFSSIISYLKDDYFELFETRFVFSIIKYHYEKNSVIISRSICKDIILDQLTADDPHKDILELVDRESDPREVPIIIDKLTDWAKRKAVLQLYEKSVIEAVERGDFEDVEKIIEDANKITSVGSKCFFFFDEVDKFFIEDDSEKFTTGFETLDMSLNQGGPSRGEVFCWMAPTGKGKSLAMVNTAAANIKRNRNVLYVTLEMTWVKTALRFVGCFTNIPIRSRFDERIKVEKLLSKIKSDYNSELIIAEFPPDEISVDVIHGVLDMLKKRRGVKIDVVVLDYLELMLSRNPAYNKDDYVRQKRVCTECDRLAKKENVLVVTATQTNRMGNDGQEKETVIGLSKVAESYGKTMPISYLVTINQTKQEYEEGRVNKGDELSPVTAAQCRFYVAKNRNGPTFITVGGRVNYETMKMIEYDMLTEYQGGKNENSKGD